MIKCTSRFFAGSAIIAAAILSLVTAIVPVTQSQTGSGCPTTKAQKWAKNKTVYYNYGTLTFKTGSINGINSAQTSYGPDTISSAAVRA